MVNAALGESSQSQSTEIGIYWTCDDVMRGCNGLNTLMVLEGKFNEKKIRG